MGDMRAHVACSGLHSHAASLLASCWARRNTGCGAVAIAGAGRALLGAGMHSVARACLQLADGGLVTAQQARHVVALPSEIGILQQAGRRGRGCKGDSPEGCPPTGRSTTGEVHLQKTPTGSVLQRSSREEVGTPGLRCATCLLTRAHLQQQRLLPRRLRPPEGRPQARQRCPTSLCPRPLASLRAHLQAQRVHLIAQGFDLQRGARCSAGAAGRAAGACRAHGSRGPAEQLLTQQRGGASLAAAVAIHIVAEGRGHVRDATEHECELRHANVNGNEEVAGRRSVVSVKGDGFPNTPPTCPGPAAWYRRRQQRSSAASVSHRAAGQWWRQCQRGPAPAGHPGRWQGCAPPAPAGEACAADSSMGQQSSGTHVTEHRSLYISRATGHPTVQLDQPGKLPAHRQQTQSARWRGCARRCRRCSGVGRPAWPGLPGPGELPGSAAAPPLQGGGAGGHVGTQQTPYAGVGTQGFLTHIAPHFLLLRVVPTHPQTLCSSRPSAPPYVPLPMCSLSASLMPVEAGVLPPLVPDWGVPAGMGGYCIRGLQGGPGAAEASYPRCQAAHMHACRLLLQCTAARLQSWVAPRSFSG